LDLAALQHKNYQLIKPKVVKKHFVRCKSKNPKDTSNLGVQQREKKETWKGREMKTEGGGVTPRKIGRGSTAHFPKPLPYL